jgi:hypothetical protein
MLIHDDPTYTRTNWETRLNQLKEKGKDPGPLYVILKTDATDHNGLPATRYEVYCERGVFYEINGDAWFVADAESAKHFL